jgi:hypothetical protein
MIKRTRVPQTSHCATAQSFFLFGPRGVGKTAWLKHTFPEARYFDLLDADGLMTLSPITLLSG